MKKIVIFISLIFLSGCATVKQSAYLNNYSLMDQGKFLERYSKNQKFDLKNYEVAVVLIDKYGLASQNQTVDIKIIEDLLKSTATQELRKAGFFTDVSNAIDDTKGPSKILLCKFAITRLDPGNRAMRWMFGEFGGGHTYVQVEGKFIDYHTQEQMFAFADRRAGAAVTDISGGDPNILIQEDIRNIILGLVKTLNNFNK